MAPRINARDLGMMVRDDLLYAEQKRAEEAGQEQLPPEQELAANITIERMPTLRAEFSALRDMQDVWEVSGMAEKVAEAMVTGAPLAGYAPGDWAAWGTVFSALMLFLDAPIESIGKTPRQVLNKRYLKAE